jgi:hypothetical protein
VLSSLDEATGGSTVDSVEVSLQLILHLEQGVSPRNRCPGPGRFPKPALSRGEALRQAMMALLDGSGAVDAAGRTVFTYGHPLFWAPYSVIGDGG